MEVNTTVNHLLLCDYCVTEIDKKLINYVHVLIENSHY